MNKKRKCIEAWIVGISLLAGICVNGGFYSAKIAYGKTTIKKASASDAGDLWENREYGKEESRLSPYGDAEDKNKDLNLVEFKGEQTVISEEAMTVLTTNTDFEIDGTTLVAYHGSDKKVIIPDGVTDIGERVFQENEIVEEIIIPDSVDRISKMAFAYAINLKRLEIGSGLNVVYNCMLTGTRNLEEIVVSSKNPYYYVEDGVLRRKRTQYIIFYPGGKKDKFYRIPDGIVNMSFEGNQYVEEIYISKDVEIVNLEGLKSLNKIVVDKDNKNFRVVDGVLYNDDMTKIVRYPSGKKGDTFVIPESVTSLGCENYDAVFPGDGELENIYFSGSCPRELSITSSESPYYDWYTAFESSKKYHIYYYNDSSWEMLQKAYDEKFGMERYFELEFCPKIKGLSIVVGRGERIIGNPLPLKVVEADFANGILEREADVEYWKVKNGQNEIDENGIFTGKVIGKDVIQAKVKGEDTLIEKEIEVIGNPDKHKEIFLPQEWELLKLINKKRMQIGSDPASVFADLQKVMEVEKSKEDSSYVSDKLDEDSKDLTLNDLNMKWEGSGKGYIYDEKNAADVIERINNDNIALNNSYEHLTVGYIEGKDLWIYMFVDDIDDVYEELFIDRIPDYQLKTGQSIDDLDIAVICYSSPHGITYIPLIEEMCTGFEPNRAGVQKVTVTYKNLTVTLKVEVLSVLNDENSGSSTDGDSSSSSDENSSSTGGDSSSSSGGNSSSTGGGSSSSLSGNGSSTSGGSSSSSGGGGGSGSRGGKSSRSGSAGSGAVISSEMTNSSSTLPDYVVKGSWTQDIDGNWYFTSSTGIIYANRWAAVYNPYANPVFGQAEFDWFYFDKNGHMLFGWFLDIDGNYYYLNPSSDGTKGRMITGWYWVADSNGIQKCYYFNPISDGTRGRMLKNTIVDGYTINENGEWTLNGVVQIK